jgi:hypothetical protein
VTVFHNVSDKDGVKSTFANMWDANGDISLGVAKYQPDPLVDTWADIPVAPQISPTRLFLFQRPTKETWDSLFVDGTRTVKEGDKEVEVSKNRLQEMIMSATDYPGSALEALLIGQIPLEMTQTPAKAVEPAAATVAPTTATTPPVAAATGPAVDPLAALGLT